MAEIIVLWTSCCDYLHTGCDEIRAHCASRERISRPGVVPSTDGGVWRQLDGVRERNGCSEER